jgi:hypothetical protein
MNQLINKINELIFKLDKNTIKSLSYNILSENHTLFKLITNRYIINIYLYLDKNHNMFIEDRFDDLTIIKSLTGDIDEIINNIYEEVTLVR